MPRKDFYLTLGVWRRENFHGVQDAFQELAKIYQPDRAGPQGRVKFQAIREAYETLSNPEKRTVYNRELEQDELNLQTNRELPFSGSQSKPDPIPPESISVLRDFATTRPSFDALFERLVRNFTQRGIPKGERLEALNVEVSLPAEQAAGGGSVPLAVPVFRTCRQCGGSGHDWLFPCTNCNALGIIEEEETVRFRMPPAVPDRTVVEVPIDRLGIRNFYLRLHIRISP